MAPKARSRLASPRRTPANVTAPVTATAPGIAPSSFNATAPGTAAKDGIAVQAVAEIFKQLDSKGDGALDAEEIGSVLQKLDPDVWGPERVQQLLVAASASSRDGSIEESQFATWLFAEGVEQSLLQDSTISAVFTYGSLRGDLGGKGDSWGVVENYKATWLPATLQGFRLYQDVSDGFPFAMHTGRASDTLAGTLVQFPEATAKEAISRCNKIEGFESIRPSSGLYRRTIVEVPVAEHNVPVLAFIYHKVMHETTGWVGFHKPLAHELDLIRFVKSPVGVSYEDAVVTKVKPGGVAADAGIETGWRVVSVEDVAVSDDPAEAQRQFKAYLTKLPKESSEEIKHLKYFPNGDWLRPAVEFESLPNVTLRPRGERRGPPGPAAKAAASSRSRSVGIGNAAQSNTSGRRNATPDPRGDSATLKLDARVYDVVLIGSVFTGLDGTDALCECIAFGREHGRICFVGSVKSLQAKTDSGVLKKAAWSRTYTVPGSVIPAFHDAHCHPFGAGNRSRQRYNDEAKAADDEQFRAAAVDLREFYTWRDVMARISAALDDQERVGAADEVAFFEYCKYETIENARSDVATQLQDLGAKRKKLIVIVVGKPYDTPVGVAVSEDAMKVLLVRYPRWAFSKNDARIERGGRRSSPSGYFHGNVWAARFSLLSPASYASLGMRGLVDGLLELPKEGIVAATDAFVFEDRVPLYEAAFANDVQRRLPRINLSLGLKDDWSPDFCDDVISRVVPARTTWEDTDFRFCLREGKVEVDHNTWSTTSERGECSWDQVNLARVINTLVRANFSMHMHVFGDLAAQCSVKLLRDAESGAAANRGSRDRRHKIAHAFEFLQNDVDLLCEMPYVYVVYQPYWFALGYSRQTAWNQNDLLVGGGRVCYGSDWDITQLSPLNAIAVALSQEKVCLRSDNEFEGRTARNDFLLGSTTPWKKRLATALRLASLEAARAHWLDGCSGTLEIGKFADLCLLDRDIFSLREDEFTVADRWGEPQIRVTATFSRGFCIFRQESPELPSLTRLRSRASAVSLQSKDDDEFLFGTCGCADRLRSALLQDVCPPCSS